MTKGSETLTVLSITSNVGPDGNAGTDDDFNELNYKDENGDDKKVDISSLVKKDETLTELSVKKNDGPDGISGNADDFDELTYKDEKGTETKVNINSLIKANNGLVVNNDNTLQLGGALTKPTTITADATNTLAIDGLQAPAPADNYEVVTADNTTGVLKKVAITSLSVRQYVKEYTVTTRGEDEFDTHQDYTSPQNVQAFRNGIRIDFTEVDANTIRLNLSEINGCFVDDEIRIVQLQ